MYYKPRQTTVAQPKCKSGVTVLGKHFAVIDTETTFSDKVMSIGVVVADTATLEIRARAYYILTPEYQEGGIYSFCMLERDYEIVTRAEAIQKLFCLFAAHNVTALFAYNATFDRRHLPEFDVFDWCDIMELAAYKQTNPRIPAGTPLCRTGRLKTYNAQYMFRLLSGNDAYTEVHNALCDAEDELQIMTLLQQDLLRYPCIHHKTER